MLCLGIGSVTDCIYSKGTKTAEIYHVRFRHLANDYSKRATADLSFYGAARPHAHDGQHNYLLYSCSCSQRFYITPNLARLRMYKYFNNRIMPISYTKQDVWSAAYLFGFTSVASTVFGFVANKLLHEQQMELNDYTNTINQVLHVFNMNKTELMALLKLAKAKNADTVYDKELMEQLDHKTLRNIIKVASHIEHLQACHRKDMRERFPMLTPAELDVCRLVEQGLTLKEVANALDKSVSNVSTVRGNIRKKLGLAQDDDLRRALLDNKN